MKQQKVVMSVLLGTTVPPELLPPFDALLEVTATSLVWQNARIAQLVIIVQEIPPTRQHIGVNPGITVLKVGANTVCYYVSHKNI